MSELSNSHDYRAIEKLFSGEAGALVEQTEERFEMPFSYLGRPRIVRLITHESGSLHMKLIGKVGYRRYSIEGREQRIGAVMLTANRRLTRFAVTHNGEVALSGDIRVAAPFIPKTLITAVSVLLASIKAYLDSFHSL